MGLPLESVPLDVVAENGSLLVGSVVGVGGKCVVGDRTDHVGLADHNIGGGPIRTGNRIPDQHAIVAQVRDEDVDPIGRDRNRIQQLVGLDVVLLLRQVRLDESGEVGLSQHDVGSRAVARRYTVEDQHAIVLCVSHIEAAVLNPHALRPAHGLRIRGTGRQGSAGEVRLADHNVCRCIVGGGNAVPYEYPVVIGVRHHHVNAVGGHRGGQAQRSRRGGEIFRHGSEIRLPQHQRGMADADRALAVVNQRIRGFGQHAREILIKKHAMIAGRRSHTIRIRNEQSVGGVGQTTGPAENGVAGIGILGGKGWLSDDQPGGLSAGKVGRAHRGRKKQKQKNAFHG